MKGKTVNHVLSEDIVKQVEELATMYNTSKSTIYELLINMSLTYFDFNQVGMELEVFDRRDGRKRTR